MKLLETIADVKKNARFAQFSIWKFNFGSMFSINVRVCVIVCYYFRVEKAESVLLSLLIFNSAKILLGETNMEGRFSVTHYNSLPLELTWIIYPTELQIVQHCRECLTCHTDRIAFRQCFKWLATLLVHWCMETVTRNVYILIHPITHDCSNCNLSLMWCVLPLYLGI